MKYFHVALQLSNIVLIRPSLGDVERDYPEAISISEISKEHAQDILSANRS